MKKLVLIACLLLTQISFAAGNPELKNEITEKLYIDLTEIDLHPDREDFVVVSFTIHDGAVTVNEISGTTEALKKEVAKQLSEMSIEGAHEEGTPYLYKFKFEKL